MMRDPATHHETNRHHPKSARASPARADFVSCHATAQGSGRSCPNLAHRDGIPTCGHRYPHAANASHKSFHRSKLIALRERPRVRHLAMAHCLQSDGPIVPPSLGRRKIALICNLSSFPKGCWLAGSFLGQQASHQDTSGHFGSAWA